MDKMKEVLQKIGHFLREKTERLRKMKRKNKWKLAGVCLAVVLAVVVVGRLFLWRRGPGKTSAQMTVQTATAETGSISTTVEGTGTLQQGTAEEITLPVGVKVEEILVEAGDAVTKGQQLATIDSASVAEQLLEVEEDLDAVEEEIDDLSDDADEEGTTEYLEALVLKGERKDLRQAKKTLNALLDAGAIEADRDGIIGEIYVSENTKVSDTSESSESSGTSTAAATSTANESAAGKTASYAVAMTATTTKTAAAVRLSQSGAVKTSLSGAENTEITSCNLTVAAPVTGKTPQTSIAETEQYTGTITWNCEDAVFQAGTAYTATIVLTAKTGYSFSSGTTVTVSGAASTSSGLKDNALEITAVFAATKESTTESTASTQTSEATTNAGASGTGNTGASGESGSTSTTTENTSGTGTTEEKADAAQKGSNETKGKESTGQSGSGFSGGTAAGGSGTASVSSSTSGSGTSSGSAEESYSQYEEAAFSIISQDEAVVSIQVDELDILSVEEGQTAVITMDAVEDQEFEGTITEVSATATGDSSSAKYPVEITMEKTDDMLYGMSASVTIQVDEAENAVLIPVSALQESGNETFVYTECDEEGNLSGEVEVTTGLSDGSQVEIVSGLSEGDTVYYLRSGTDSQENTFPSMGGGMNGGMPSGERSGSGKENGAMGGGSGEGRPDGGQRGQ